MTRNMPALLFGSFVLVLGAAVLVVAGSIPKGFGYDVVGPQMLPKVAGAGLVLSALVILGEAVLRPGAADGDFTGVDVWPVALMSAALLAEAVLIARIGWVPVVTILFATGAWAFGDRRVMSNLLIGFSVGLVVLVAFRFGLGIDLPLGPLAPLLPVTS